MRKRKSIKHKIKRIIHLYGEDIGLFLSAISMCIFLYMCYILMWTLS